MKIAVDGMGGDFAPGEIVKGAVMAAREYDVGIILVGPEEMMRAELAKHDCSGLDIEVVHTEMAGEQIGSGKTVHAMFHYTDGIAAAEELRDIVTSKIDCAEVHFTPYTPVMASQTGPVVAISFYTE